MRIIDPQSAVLTNIEVLAYISANPPRRPPPAPPNSNLRNWAPSPDLRDHNTVIKEIHNYVTRVSPHLLKYPRHAPRPSSSQSQSHSQAAMTGTMRPTAPAQTTEIPSIPPPIPTSDPTPMDRALRDLITKLLPYGLTKAEVVMILNLGLGLRPSEGGGQGGEHGGEEMDVDEGGLTNGAGEEGEGGEEDFGALALFDTVVEEREDRIAEEDVPVILSIIRETLAEGYGG